MLFKTGEDGGMKKRKKNNLTRTHHTHKYITNEFMEFKIFIK